ncbi:hypothetical protein VTK26DRAFT_5615 [Humicola hyalothermophila]
MRLPEIRPSGPGRLSKRLLGDLVGALGDVLCKTLPNAPGCASPDPAPSPDPDPSPDPSPDPEPDPKPNTPTVISPPPASDPSNENDSPSQDSPDKGSPPPPPPPAAEESEDSHNISPPATDTESIGSGNSGSSDSSNSGQPKEVSGSNGSDSENDRGSGSEADDGASRPPPATDNNSQHVDGPGAGSGTSSNGNASSGGSNQPSGEQSSSQGSPGQSDGPKPTPTVGTAPDRGNSGSNGISDGWQSEGTANPTVTVTLAAPEATKSSTGQFNAGAFDGLEGDYGDIGSGPVSDAGPTIIVGGGIGDAGSGSNGDNNKAEDASRPSSILGIVGGVVAILLVLLVLLALLLYRYRHTRRVRSFLARFSPSGLTGYTRFERKRSSMGNSLLFSDGSHGDALLNEKRASSFAGITLNYGTTTAPTTILPAPVTHPTTNTSMYRPDLHHRRPADAPPPLITSFGIIPSPATKGKGGSGSSSNNNNKRASTPISPLEVSPLSAVFPRSPKPTAAVAAKRSSQDSSVSSDGVSIASSGIFSASMLSWPMPPSLPSSPPGSSRSTATGGGGLYGAGSGGFLGDWGAPVTSSSGGQGGGGGGCYAHPQVQQQSVVRPPTPSNWQKPVGWD